MPKDWWFQIVVLERLESLMDCRRSNQSILKEINLNVHWKDRSWSSNTLATWCEEPTHWKRPWCWERLRAKGEGSSRGWDGRMAPLIQWTWVWANSRRSCRTGKPGVLRSVRTQRVTRTLTAKQQCKRIPFYSHLFQHLLFIEFFDYRHSDPSEVIPHCSFSF